MDRYEAMRSFVQVVASGGLTPAADALGVHKATVSQHLRKLEQHLGVRLLTRTTRSVAPTADGLAFLERARLALEAMDEAVACVGTGQRVSAGHLRVDVPVALGREVFVAEIGEFLTRHPGVSIEINVDDSSTDLVSTGTDCALRAGPLRDSTLVTRRVAELRFLLVAGRAYVDRAGSPAEITDLCRHTAIGHRGSARRGGARFSLGRDGESQDVEMPARLSVNDSASALAACLNGLGITAVSAFVAAPLLANGSLVHILPEWHPPARPLYMVTPTSKLRSARVKAFMNWAETMLVRRLGASAAGLPG